MGLIFVEVLLLCLKNYPNLLQTWSLVKVIIEKSRGEGFLWKIFEIWAGLGPVGNTEKKIGGQLQAFFEGGSFMFSGAKKNVIFKKYIAAFALKSCIKWR